tara:strand:+ start:168 stop:518 length:351 start_codon:yes stop_codon:yes gene_type:complete
MTIAQWAWYSLMISGEEEASYKKELNFTEYLASFINSDAVKHIRSMREAKEDERFMSDEEFEKFSEEDWDKADDFVKTIRDKYKNTNNIGRSRDPRDIRLPKNLSNILKITKDDTD